jgi:hypothetical protein
MVFLNLTFGEFLGLAAAFSGAIVALYLLDRSRRKQIVATLRFFPGAADPPRSAHRRHFEQPWSLLLQIASVLLLLLALAQVRFSQTLRAVHDHVLILDTSSWMNARSGEARLIDAARAAARRYIRALPAQDRVMVERAGAAPSPAGGFTAGRETLLREIDSSQPGASALDLEQALRFALEARRVAGDEPGEIAFAGAGRVAAGSDATLPAIPGLRILPVSSGPRENHGLAEVTVRRSADDPDTWQIFVSSRNYGETPVRAIATVWFDGAVIGQRAFLLAPRGSHDETFSYTTRAAGRLDVRLTPGDAFPADNSVQLILPAQPRLPVVVYSADPTALKSVFIPAPGIAAEFVPPSRYPLPASQGGLQPIAVFDRFAPPAVPTQDAIWIDPPARQSPIPIVNDAAKTNLTAWNGAHPLGLGLRATGFDLPQTLTFRPGPGDIVVAGSSAGPVIVARSTPFKTVVLGFDPAATAMKYQLSTPLLFANILHWMAPEVFRRQEFSARAPGAVNVAFDTPVDPANVHVTASGGSGLPFTCDGSSLRFFTADPGIVRIATPEGERVLSLTLPSPGDTLWHPASVRAGFPPPASPVNPARDWWPWLALAGGAGLLADWLLYGRARTIAAPRRTTSPAAAWRKAS